MILSIENAKSWSWGLTFSDYEKHWGEMVRIIRQPKLETVFFCSECGSAQKQSLDGMRIEAGLIEHFDLCLVQNVDTLVLMDSFENVVARIGGLVVDENTDPHRYDEYLAKCPAVITTNRFLQNIGAGVNANTTLIPNGLDLEAFRPPEERHSGRFTVGFAGNIHGFGLEYKGYKWFVQATLDLYGKVEAFKRLHTHNQVDHDCMPAEFYHKIDCLLLPSLGEGCSNVTMEALACGVPVLITPVGYHGEMLTHEENCLFISRDTQSITSAIMRLKDDQDLWKALSVSGREFAEQHHDIKVIAAQYQEVFDSVLERV